jgi:hypothetical protein
MLWYPWSTAPQEHPPIQDVMTFLSQPYYVGLLSAAALYGATHHAVQQFLIFAVRQNERLLFSLDLPDDLVEWL